MKFARQVDGGWCDPADAPDEETLDERYHPEWIAARKAEGAWFQEVSDDIYAALTYVPPPPIIYRSLSASAFQDVCEKGFGGGSAGMARFGNVVRAMETSQDDLVLAAYQRFLKSTAFDRAKAAPFFSLLANSKIISTDEGNTILNAWPTV